MHPTLNFTETEFVQAGLLPSTNLSSCTQAPNCLPASQQEALHITFSDTLGMTPHEAHQQHQPGSPRGHPWSPLQQLTHRQVQDIDMVRGCNDKKHMNREHQRKFRERQKVNTPSCRLDSECFCGNLTCAALPWLVHISGTRSGTESSACKHH